MRDEARLLISKGLKYSSAIGGFKQHSDTVRFTLMPLASPRGQTERDRNEKKGGQSYGPRMFFYSVLFC